MRFISLVKLSTGYFVGDMFYFTSSSYDWSKQVYVCYGNLVLTPVNLIPGFVKACIQRAQGDDYHFFVVGKSTDLMHFGLSVISQEKNLKKYGL